jgi:hypothetical protein
MYGPIEITFPANGVQAPGGGKFFAWGTNQVPVDSATISWPGGSMLGVRVTAPDLGPNDFGFWFNAAIAPGTQVTLTVNGAAGVSQSSTFTVAP